MSTSLMGEYATVAPLRQRLRAGTTITERRIEAAGIATMVLECGQGPPLVLLHGPGEFAESWIEVVSALAATNTVVAPDLPGHGCSAGGDIDAERVLTWLDDLIGQTCDGAPVLVGRVLGGAIAARFAIDHGDRLGGLVLVDTMGLTSFEPAPPFGEALHRYFGDPTEQTFDGLMQYCSYDLAALRRRLGERWQLLAAYAVDRARAPGVLAAIDALMAQFAVEIREAELSRIAVPTALIWGRHDMVTPLHVAEAAGRAFGWPLHVVEGAADDPALDQPDRFVAVLRAAIEEGALKMTTTEVMTTLDAVRALAPAIATRIDEIERGRRLPLDLIGDLVGAGCFRSAVPRTHGGDEASLVDHLAMVEELALVDGSVGWTVMIGSAAPVLLGHLPAASFDAVYAAGPDVIVAGTFNPTGRATPVAGGYRVSGQWSFASGCQHAHRFIAHCVVDDGRMPPLRMMVLPAADVEIVDTWSTVGMCGTGSHDFTAADVFVADEWSFSIFEPPEADFTAVRIPELCLSTMNFAAVAVGIAAGALADIVELAAGKVPMFADATLAMNPLFRTQLGEADAALRAARTLLRHDAEEAWAMALDGAGFDDPVRARFRSDTTWIAATAAHIVDAAYRAGGGTAVYTSSPLQRRLRDIRTLTQHFGVKLDTYTLAGAVLAGQQVDTSFL